MSTECTGIVLVKFQDEQYIKPFYEKGLVYMNPLSFFQKIKNNDIRGDKNENLTRILQSESILVNNVSVPIMGHIELYDPNDDIDKFTHIFCMSSLCSGDNIGKNGKIFDERIHNFGNHLVIVHNLKEFFNRLKAAVHKLIKNKRILGCKTDRVIYINENKYSGKTNVFNKFSSYSWQKEWRLAIRTNKDTKQPFHFEIGGISDISKILDTNDFKNEIKLIKGNQILNF